MNIRANDEDQIWIKDLDRGPLPKLTFTGTQNSRPAWTPDGRSVAFVSDRGENSDLYVRRVDASTPAELLLDDELPLSGVTFSPDEEWLIYQRGETGNSSLHAVRVGGDSVPVALVVTGFREVAPAVSPDGRWLAYASTESRRWEVYVSPFPNTNDGKWLVSTDGGTEPVWAHSGRELFYKSGASELISAEVVPGTTFVVGEQRALFSTTGYRNDSRYQAYDVTADDQRFVMVRVGTVGVGDLIMVENFFEELKAKVGN